jgi:divalent metal cation (Fe/Co/Zn/Cd) transporter
MLVSAVTSAMVHLVLLRIGREEDSVCLLAAAAHNRIDIFSSLGVALALAVVWVGQDAVAGIELRWIDTVAAIVVAVLNIEVVLDLILAPGKGLWGSATRRDEEEHICDLVAGHRPEIRGVQHVRARSAGHFRFVDFRVIADPRLTGEDCQTLRKKVSQNVRAHFRRTRVEVRVEPCKRGCESECANTCALLEEHGLNAALTRK